MELFLQASVHFNEVVPPVPEGFVEDPFCVGLNCYAEVRDILTTVLIFYNILLSRYTLNKQITCAVVVTLTRSLYHYFHRPSTS